MNSQQLPRFERHPGSPSAARFVSVRAMLWTPRRLVIEHGVDLFDGIETYIDGLGVETAAFRLLGGVVSHLSLMTGKPADRPGQVATFHGPHPIACPALVLGGHGCIGSGSMGGTVIHAHASFLDASGIANGCHLIRGQCIADEGGVVLAIYPVDDARLVVRQDTETRFDVFHPEAVSTAVSS